MKSHPTRVRGLKQNETARRQQEPDVAPHAGAWIETALILACLSASIMSHPTRVRGLKHQSELPEGGRSRVAPHAGAWIETDTKTGTMNIGGVAPHAGAWIETYSPSAVIGDSPSHPTRVRGLKPSVWSRRQCRKQSHPTRVRGLKLDRCHALSLDRMRRTPRGCVD